MTLEMIYIAAGLTIQEMQKMPEYLDWNDEFYSSSAYDKLYEYFTFETHEMPYNIAKARTGDPDVWILEKLEKIS